MRVIGVLFIAMVVVFGNFVTILAQELERGDLIRKPQNRQHSNKRKGRTNRRENKPSPSIKNSNQFSGNRQPGNQNKLAAIKKESTKQSKGGGSQSVQSQKKKPAVEPLIDPSEVYFTVLEFQVEGNTLLPDEKVHEILEGFTGFAQQIRDIDKARIALEKVYHEAGYPTVLVSLPRQTIEGGIVKLEVLESKINNITVTGNRYFSNRNILEKLPSLKPGTILYEPTLNKELRAVDAHPDRDVSPVLKPGEEPGTVDLELKVNDRIPLHASVSADNKGSLNTPRNRLVADIQYTNLFDREHILTLQTVQTPQEWGAVQVYGFTYVAPLGQPNRLISLYGAIADTNSVLAGTGLPAAQAGSIGVVGNSRSAGIFYSFPFEVGGPINHQFNIGLDYMRLEGTNASFPADLGTAVVTSPVQYTPLTLKYTGILPHHRGVTSLSTSLRGYVAGVIPEGGESNFAGNPNDPNNPGNRVGSTGTFGIVKGSLDRSQPLPFNLLLVGHADGQWASEPLIAAEELFAGGLNTVRGYLQNETLGDQGVRTRVELLTPWKTIHFDRPFNSFWKANIRFLAFYDTAFLWIRRPRPGQTPRFQLEGAGFGLRGQLTEYINLILDNGWALRDAVFTKRGDTFTHFAVTLAL